MCRFLTLILAAMSLEAFSQSYSGYAQLPPKQTGIEQLRGKVKKITTTYYYTNNKRCKVVSEYDTSGRIIFKINYYNKKNPLREYFSYNSDGRLTSRIYENNTSSHQYTYEYHDNSKGLITTLLQLRDEEFFIQYDSIVYNNDNQPVQYIIKSPRSSELWCIRYINENHKKIIHIEKKHNSGTIDSIQETCLYNEKGFLTKENQESVTRIITKDGISPFRHSEEYDYVDYKYDTQDNWTERKIYLNWEERGRKLHVKIKRKIEYS
jgi:hypothetical protein